MRASGTIISKGTLRARFHDRRDHTSPYVSLWVEDAEIDSISIVADLENAERLRLAAAALNGELGDLLEDLFEFCDDLGDGAPDSPPYAHRALNLAERLNAVLPEAPKPAGVPA